MHNQKKPQSSIQYSTLMSEAKEVKINLKDFVGQSPLKNPSGEVTIRYLELLRDAMKRKGPEHIHAIPSSMVPKYFELSVMVHTVLKNAVKN